MTRIGCGLILLLVALVLAACSEDSASSEVLEPVAASDTTYAPAFTGTWWRLHALEGAPPVTGVRPVLIFTETPAAQDTYDRPYPARFSGWQIVNGESGVGRLHAPYKIDGDTLLFADTYDYTRLSTDAEIAQATQLATVLSNVRRFVQRHAALHMLDASSDTLASFIADPPREPTPLDNIEWILDDVEGRTIPDSLRATLTFTSRRLGPGPEDGYYSMEGYSGCNWYGNGYRLRGGKGTYQLEVAGPAMSTARGCGPAASDLEKAFHDAIQRARRVVEQGNRLTLFDSSQTELLTLHRHILYPVDLAELRRESWRLASPSSNSPSWSDPMDVTFADSTFEAISGCYQVRGEYRVAGDNFYVLAMGADASECASHRRDQVPPIPITGGKLSVDADRLILYDENGHATAFTRPS